MRASSKIRILRNDKKVKREYNMKRKRKTKMNQAPEYPEEAHTIMKKAQKKTRSLSVQITKITPHVH